MRHLSLTTEDVTTSRGSPHGSASRIADCGRSRTSRPTGSPVAGLWKHGISGDLPILLVRAADGAAIPLVRQALAAREYCAHQRLRLRPRRAQRARRGIPQGFLRSALSHSSRAARPRPGSTSPAGLHPPGRSDDARGPRAVAGGGAGSIDGSRGSWRHSWRFPHCPRQLSRLARRRRWRARTAGATFRRRPVARRCPPRGPAALQRVGRLRPFGPRVRHHRGHRKTDACAVGQCRRDRGGGPARDGSRRRAPSGRATASENRLTPWSNDAVMDPPTAGVYLRDAQSGRLWSPTRSPAARRPRSFRTGSATPVRAGDRRVADGADRHVPDADGAMIL